MGFARAAGVPVVLVGDIERGGVIAAAGRHAWRCWSPRSGRCWRATSSTSSAATPRCSTAAHPVIEARTGPALAWRGAPGSSGRAACPKEDMLGSAELARGRVPAAADPDRRCRGCRGWPISTISTRWRPSPTSMLGCWSRASRCRRDADLVILPGQQGDAGRPRGAAGGGLGHRHPRPMSAAAAGCSGLCGGYQMLGRSIADPDGRRGAGRGGGRARAARGRHGPGGDKGLALARASSSRRGETVRGYEMHMGRTAGPGLARPMLELGGRRRRRGERATAG